VIPWSQAQLTISLDRSEPQIPVKRKMKSLLAVKPILVTVGSLIVCALMAGCGAGSIGSLAQGTVASTQNPLVALYTIATSCPGQIMVEFGPTTNYGRTTAWSPVLGNYVPTSVLVAGMMASTTYHMRALEQCNNGTTSTSPDTTFTTGPLPTSSYLTFPQITVSRPNPSLSSTENPGIESVDVTVGNTPAICTDRDGNVIWYYDTGPGYFAFPFKLLANGDMLLNVTNGLDTILREIDLAGNTIREMTAHALQLKMANVGGFDFIPFGLHHDFLQLPNGHFIVIAYVIKNFTNLPGYPGTLRVLGDAIVDLDQNWNPVWGWSTFDHLDINRHLLGLPDWTHSNALIYTPDDGNLLLSIRHQSWIIKIDYENGAGSGNILWHLGYQGDFALTINGVPTEDPSEWFSFQHFPRLLSQNGSQENIAVWDNGDLRVLDAATDELCEDPRSGSTYPPCYSRATLFQLDESSMVANLTWADPVLYYGTWGGGVNQFSNGNVEFEANAMALPPNPAIASLVEEVTDPSNPQIVWQMEISPSNLTAYRAYRVPSLYNGVTWPY
jgi:arylsulfate sulfotransferase